MIRDFFSKKWQLNIRLYWLVVGLVLLLFFFFSLQQFVVGLAITLFALLAGLFLRNATNEGRHTVEGLAALLSCLALIAAGYWFLIERRSVPKVNLDPSILTWSLGNGSALARVELKISNVGDMAVEIDRDDPVIVEIGRVMPARGRHIRMMQDDYSRSADHDSNLIGVMRTDIYSPVARLDNRFHLSKDPPDPKARKNGELEFNIEAGETERRYFKAIIPCENGLVSSIRVELPKKLNWLQKQLDRQTDDQKGGPVYRAQALSNKIEEC